MSLITYNVITYLVVIVGENSSDVWTQPDSVLTRPLPLKSGRGLVVFSMFLFLAPSGTQSEGTRDPIQNLPPTAPPPLSFPAHKSWTPPPQTHTFQYYMISFVGIFHPYQAYIRTRLVRFIGVHQIPTDCKRSDFHEKYLAAQPQLEGWFSSIGRVVSQPHESTFPPFPGLKKATSRTGFTT